MSNLNEQCPTSLDLNDIIKTTIRTELRKFGKEHPNCKFNIICDLDEEATDTINEINEYLVENQCPERLKTGGQIIMKDRTTFFRYTKKEVL